MDGQLFSWLLAQGGFAGIAALFFFLWQKSEAKGETLQKEVKSLLEAQVVVEKTHGQALREQSEKRFMDNQRIEGVVNSNADAMKGNQAAITAVLPLLQMIAGRAA